MSQVTEKGPARLRGAAEKRGKRSGVRAALFLAVALLIALGTALLLTRYMEARTAAARTPTRKVVVAAMDLQIATTLREEALAVVDWPVASVPEGTFSDRKALAKRVVIAPLFKGEPVLAPKLASSDAGNGLAAILPPGMRAAAVRVDDVVGVAGFVHPGDRVDVIVTMKPSENGNVPPVSKIILQNIRVLAVGKEIAQSGKNLDKALPATVATLMVDSEQSEKLALAASKGQLLLTLRSAIDTDQVDTDGMAPPVLLAGTLPEPPPAAKPEPARGRRAPARKAAPGVAAAPAPAPPEKEVVEILRGDLFERRDFEKKGAKP